MYGRGGPGQRGSLPQKENKITDVKFVRSEAYLGDNFGRCLVNNYFFREFSMRKGGGGVHPPMDPHTWK